MYRYSGNAELIDKEFEDFQFYRFKDKVYLSYLRQKSKNRWLKDGD